MTGLRFLLASLILISTVVLGESIKHRITMGQSKGGVSGEVAASPPQASRGLKSGDGHDEWTCGESVKEWKRKRPRAIDNEDVKSGGRNLLGNSSKGGGRPTEDVPKPKRSAKQRKLAKSGKCECPSSPTSKPTLVSIDGKGSLYEYMDRGNLY